MARTKNKPILKRSGTVAPYVFRNVFLRNHHHNTLSDLSQTFIWFEKYWLDNKFAFQPYSFDELFQACDKTKFPYFCRKFILRGCRTSAWKYTKQLISLVRYFYDSLIGPSRKFDIHFDVRRGKILKTRCAMTLSEVSNEVIGFVDNMPYDSAEVFNRSGYNSLYTNLAGRSSEYVIPMFGLLKFVAHSCDSDIRISRRPEYKHLLGNRKRCIQMLIERTPPTKLLNAGSEIVMNYCYAGPLPFICHCNVCISKTATV